MISIKLDDQRIREHDDEPETKMLDTAIDFYIASLIRMRSATTAPATIQTYTDRITIMHSIQARIKNAEPIQEEAEEAQGKFYFTFGSDPEYPFGRDKFVLVKANGLKAAILKFKARHPNRPGSNTVNCAAWYNEKQWARGRRLYKQPIHVSSQM